MPRFLARRALRLYPAFVVASVISVFIVGPLGAAVAGDYFRELDLKQVLVGFLMLHEPHTPIVFAGTSVESVNGSTWTISFEARCYLLAMLLGLAGLFRKRTALLILTVIVRCAISYAAPRAGSTDNQYLLFGIKALRVSDWMTWFAALFLTGSCFFVFQNRIRFTLWGFFLATCVLAASLFNAVLLHCGRASCWQIHTLFSRWRLCGEGRGPSAARCLTFPVGCICTVGRSRSYWIGTYRICHPGWGSS
ncbi:MAG: hypothetical protein CBHOC_1991 [uncultured Caballeronia sp.]|nr:MAG: hypothetical protein CBHOC_1991 [uncultured Caballeronia sp.]